MVNLGFFFSGIVVLIGDHNLCGRLSGALTRSFSLLRSSTASGLRLSFGGLIRSPSCFNGSAVGGRSLARRARRGGRGTISTGSTDGAANLEVKFVLQNADAVGDGGGVFVFQRVSNPLNVDLMRYRVSMLLLPLKAKLKLLETGECIR